MEKLFIPALLLQSIVALVLFVACVNLASLLLARGAARRHEMAIRTAVGAGRGRLVRLLLTESVVLSTLGAGAGLLVAVWVKTLLLRLFTRFDPSFHINVQFDLNVILFTLAAAAATALLCGTLPALRTSRAQPASALQGGRTSPGPHLRLSRILLVGQVALSLLLVTGAGLLARTLINLRQVNPGFDRENLLLFRVDPWQAGYRNQKLLNFYEDLRQSLAAIPGVRSVTLSDRPLLGRGRVESNFSIPGSSDEKDRLQAHQLTVSDGYFSTMNIALLRGREFNRSDGPGAPRVVIVNETFARSLFGEKDALGRSIQSGNDICTIVGICRDTKYSSLREAMPPTLYFPVPQASPRSVYFAGRTILPPESIVPAVRKTVAALDPTLPLADITTQTDLLEDSLMAERLFARLCGSMAALALLLCCIGLHGLTAYNVARRSNEIGVRMALGATAQQVGRSIIRESLITAGWGIALGLPAAFGLSLAMRSAVYGLQLFDPFTMAAAVSVLFGVAALAAWIPARRAAKIEPMEALRCE